VKILKEKGDTNGADNLIQKLSAKENPIQKWVIATSNNDQAALATLEKDFEKNTRFMILKRLAEVTK